MTTHVRQMRPGRAIRTLATACLTLALPVLIMGCADQEQAETDVETNGAAATDTATATGPNTITIFLGTTGMPSVDKARACAAGGQSVQWQWEQDEGPITGWIVLFKGDSPLVGDSMRVESNENNPNAPVSRAIKTGLAHQDSFSYDVKVVLEDGDTLGEDPDIVIWEPQDDESVQRNCQW